MALGPAGRRRVRRGCVHDRGRCSVQCDDDGRRPRYAMRNVSGSSASGDGRGSDRLSTIGAMTETRSRADLRADGDAARAALPPADLGAWAPAPDRPDPVELLESQAATRLAQLVPVRYGRMAVSPFTFYRGAALPMAADLSAGPRSSIIVTLCGDAHLVNFGLFASP